VGPQANRSEPTACQLLGMRGEEQGGAMPRSGGRAGAAKIYEVNYL